MYSINFWHLFHLYGRKVICLFAIVSLFASQKSTAQMNLTKHDRKKIHFGIAMSGIRSQFSVSRSAAFINNDTIQSVTSPVAGGFGLAIVSNLKISEHIDLRVIPGISLYSKQLDYTERIVDDSQFLDEAIESIIISTPVSLKFKSDRFFDNFRFYVLSGMRFDYDMASNASKQRADDIIKLKAFDMAAEVGFGFEIYFPMFIFKPEVKFSRGLIDMHAPTENYIYSEVLDKLRSRMLTFSFQFEG